MPFAGDRPKAAAQVANQKWFLECLWLPAEIRGGQKE